MALHICFTAILKNNSRYEANQKTILMKHLFFLMAAFMLASHSNAQLAEGRHMLGANINYTHRLQQRLDTTNSQPKTTDNNNGLNLGINYGSMITDHLMLGIRGGFQNQAIRREAIYQRSR